MRFFRLAVCSLLACVAVFAQGERGTITGTVSDPAGAVVPAAAVSVKNTDTGYEGTWDQRLKHLAELPKGKTAGLFQSSDIFKVKEIVGDTMCIVGGMRNSLLQAGSADEVRKFTIELCEKVGKGGGFIMSTTVGEMEGCKPELVKVWVDTTKEYGVYK